MNLIIREINEFKKSMAMLHMLREAPPLHAALQYTLNHIPITLWHLTLAGEVLRNQLRVEVASSEVGPSQVIPAVDFLVVAVRPTQRVVVGAVWGDQ